MTTLQTEASEEKKRPPRFLLAMPDDVRTGIERAAFVSGRTLTAEINMRLEASLRAEAKTQPPAAPCPQAGAYPTGHAPTVLHTANEKGPANALSGIDQAMLEVFRALPPEKQLALLSLFR